MNLPFLTGEFSGIGGSIKQRPEDFFVQEIPLYEPSGQGEHVYCEIEKMGITTFDAIDRVAQGAERQSPRCRLCGPQRRSCHHATDFLHRGHDGISRHGPAFAKDVGPMGSPARE